jgi:hypothetical protein
MDRQANEVGKRLYGRGLYAVQPYPQRAYARSALDDAVSLQPRGGHRGGAGWCQWCACGTGTPTGTWITTTTMLQGNCICCVSNTSPLPQLARWLSSRRLCFLTSRQHTTCLATSFTSLLSSHLIPSRLVSSHLAQHAHLVPPSQHHYLTTRPHCRHTAQPPATRQRTRALLGRSPDKLLPGRKGGKGGGRQRRRAPVRLRRLRAPRLVLVCILECAVCAGDRGECVSLRLGCLLLTLEEEVKWWRAGRRCGAVRDSSKDDAMRCDPTVDRTSSLPRSRHGDLCSFSTVFINPSPSSYTRIAKKYLPIPPPSNLFSSRSSLGTRHTSKPTPYPTIPNSQVPSLLALSLSRRAVPRRHKALLCCSP